MITITGSDIAAIIASVTALVTGLGTLAQSLRNGRKVDQQAVASVESAKIIARKIDANTELTKDTATKVQEVHDSNAVLVQTGVFRAMLAPDKEDGK